MGLVHAAGVAESDSGTVIDFLLYYGVVGLRTTEGDMYIYHVNYDSRKLAIRIDRANESARFCVNPAFRPALSIYGCNG